MDYIKASEFLKQSEKVQKVLMEWWKLNEKELDLCVNRNYVAFIRELHLLRGMEGELIPIFSETQLRKFIQDKGYKQIGINNYIELDKWDIRVFKDMARFEPNYEHIGDTLLECFWQVACKIAEEL